MKSVVFVGYKEVPMTGHNFLDYIAERFNIEPEQLKTIKKMKNRRRAAAKKKNEGSP